jgi:hypothetical protein
VKRGDWVRMKRGIYKGDLAQVLATADQGTQITMKVIPRVDYTKLGNEEKPGIILLQSALSIPNYSSRSPLHS